MLFPCARDPRCPDPAYTQHRIFVVGALQARPASTMDNPGSLTAMFPSLLVVGVVVIRNWFLWSNVCPLCTPYPETMPLQRSVD